MWFRRDLRLDDNPALQAALRAGHVPVPVYIHAPEEEAPWAPGAPTVLIANMPSLDNVSKCLCTWGGAIAFSMPGTVKTMIP